MRNFLTLLILALGALSSFAQGTTVTTRYQTVADMVAATIQNVPANTRLTALVSGRITTNDGGGGTFFFVPGNTSTTNLGTIHPSTGVAGRWLRQYSGALNVQWFGADRTGTTDASTAIQAAINVFDTAATGGTVYVPQGVYLIGTKLLIKQAGVRLIGDAYGGDAYVGSTLKATGAITVLQTGDNTVPQTVDWVAVENIVLDGNSDTGTIGLHMEGTHFSEFNNITVRNFSSYGVSVAGEIFSVKLRGVYVTGCQEGFHVVNAPSAVNRLYFDDCRAEINTGDGYSFTGTTLVNLISSDSIFNGRGVAATGCNQLNIIGCHFEQNTTNEIEYYKQSPSVGAGVSGGLITGSWFYGVNVAGPVAIKSRGSGNLTIGANFYQRYPDGTYDFDNTGESGTINTVNFINQRNIDLDPIMYKARDGLYESYPTTDVTSSEMLRFNGTTWTNTLRIRDTGTGITATNLTVGSGTLGASPFNVVSTTASGLALLTTSQGASQIRFTSTAATPSDIIMGADNTFGTGGFGLYSVNGSAYRLSINSAGAVATHNQLSFANANNGDIITPNARGLRAVNAAGSVTLGVIGLDATNRVSLDPNGGGTVTYGNLIFTDVGEGLMFREAANGRMGRAVLVNGTVTVNNTSVTASTEIFLTRRIQAGTTVGILSVGTVTAATSFVINSLDLAGALSADDDSTVNWLLVEPSP